MNAETIITYCLSKPGTYETRPFGPLPICFRIAGKIYAQLDTNPETMRITLKAHPDNSYMYRDMYPNIIVRGYHCPAMQQPYWNTFCYDYDKTGNIITDELIIQMIDEAYDYLLQSLTKKEKLRFSNSLTKSFVYTNGQNKDFGLMCQLLDEDLERIVSGTYNRDQYKPYNLCDDIQDVIVIYHNKTPIGCGSFKFYDESTAELKRIYVNEDYRGQGLGLELVRRLHAIAKIKGYSYMCLETGELLYQSMNLYKKLGYKVIDNYGQYADMPESVCMKIKL